MDLTQRIKELVRSVQHLGTPSAYQDAKAIETDLLKVVQGGRQIESRCRAVHQELVDFQLQMGTGTLDYLRPAVLYVDDEQRSLKCFARAYGKTFRILTASTAHEGLRVLKEAKEPIAILMANHRMPGKNGRWILDRARQLHPRVLRILVSSFSSETELQAASTAANSGAIYTYLIQPWDPVHLEHLLKRALEYYLLRNAVDAAAVALHDGTEAETDQIFALIA